jgi:uncharacterized protein
MMFARPRRLAVRALGAALLAGVLGSGCVMLETKERELTWRPIREAASWYGGVPDTVHDFYLPVRDGHETERIHAWWWPADAADAPAVLYLHGARWNLTGQLRRIRQLREFGFSVLAIDYRGFGKSDGDLPSERTVYEDAGVAWRWLAERQPDASRRYIYGHSLGGAVAVDLAARVSAEQPGAAGLIVESSFTTLAELAMEMSYRWLPLSLILAEKFDSLGKMTRVTMPVLIVHGANDRYVPARFGEALFAAARAPKKLLLVDGGGHNNSMWMGSDAYRQALTEVFGLRSVDGVAEASAPPRPARTRAPATSG